MRCTPSVFCHTSGREVYRSQLRSFCRQRSHYGARAQKCVVIYDAGPRLVPVCDRCPDVRAVGFVEKIVHLFNYPVHFFTVQRELVLSVFFQRYTDCRTWVCSSSSTPPELRSRRGRSHVGILVADRLDFYAEMFLDLYRAHLLWQPRIPRRSPETRQWGFRSPETYVSDRSRTPSTGCSAWTDNLRRRVFTGQKIHVDGGTFRHMRLVDPFARYIKIRSFLFYPRIAIMDKPFVKEIVAWVIVIVLVLFF